MLSTDSVEMNDYEVDKVKTTKACRKWRLLTQRARCEQDM